MFANGALFDQWGRRLQLQKGVKRGQQTRAKCGCTGGIAARAPADAMLLASPSMALCLNESDAAPAGKLADKMLKKVALEACII